MNCFDYEIKDLMSAGMEQKFKEISKNYYETKIEELQHSIDEDEFETDEEYKRAWDDLFILNVNLAYYVDDEYTNMIVNQLLPACENKHCYWKHETTDELCDALLKDFKQLDLFNFDNEQDCLDNDLYKLPVNEPDEDPNIEELSQPLFDHQLNDPFEGPTPYFDFINSTDPYEFNCDCQYSEDKPKMNIEKDKKNLEKYEMVQHPQHYNTYSVEVIDMFEKIYGVERTADWCEMTALKYRMRMGAKPENPINQDLKKEQWYLEKAKELRSKINK